MMPDVAKGDMTDETTMDMTQPQIEAFCGKYPNPPANTSWPLCPVSAERIALDT